MNAIFHVEGGIGHHFVMSVVFRKYKERYPDHIIHVFAPWINVLHRNKYIDTLNDPGAFLPLENIVKKGHYLSYNPTVYRERLQTRKVKYIPGAVQMGFDPEDFLHIKQIVGLQCGVKVEREDFLDYFSTADERKAAKNFRKNMCGGKLLGIVQCEGTGIAAVPGQPNVLANLKKLPEEVANEVIKATKDRIYWVQVRTKQEQHLNVDFELVEMEQRKLFALMGEADLGFGTDSFGQHLMSGVYNIPFIMAHGRSMKSAYAHQACIPVGNADSCPYDRFGCDAPEVRIDRICDDLYCMKSIKAEQIITEIEKVVSKSKEYRESRRDLRY